MRLALCQIHLKHSPCILGCFVEPTGLHQTLRGNAKHFEVIRMNLEHHLRVP